MDKRHENLIPLNKRTKNEQRKIQSKGGKASGEKRRSITSMREMATVVMGLKPAVDDRMRKKVLEMGYDPDSNDINISFLTLLSLGQAAAKGDIKAAKLLTELTGDSENTVLQLARIQLERDRIALERMKLGADEDMAGKANDRILKLADLINNPTENRSLDGGVEE